MESTKAILDVLSVDLFSDDQSLHSMSDRALKRIYVAVNGDEKNVVHCAKDIQAGSEVEGFIDSDDLFHVVKPDTFDTNTMINNVKIMNGVVMSDEMMQEFDKTMASVTAFDDFEDIVNMPFGNKGYVPVYVSSITTAKKKRTYAIVQTRKQQHEILIEGAMPVNSVWQKIEIDMQPQKAYMLLCESNHMYEDGYRIVELKEMKK